MGSGGIPAAKHQAQPRQSDLRSAGDFRAGLCCGVVPLQPRPHAAVATPTKHNTPRSLATVSLEMALLSRIFSLAMDFKEVETNPCLKVAKLKLDNQRYRYLLPEEEPRLRSVLIGQRSHLAELVPVAIGTGLRKNEQLALQVKHIDFVRNLILVTGTKTRKNREVPMNSEVREIMLRLSSFKGHRGLCLHQSQNWQVA